MFCLFNFFYLNFYLFKKNFFFLNSNIFNKNKFVFNNSVKNVNTKYILSYDKYKLYQFSFLNKLQFKKIINVLNTFFNFNFNLVFLDLNYKIYTPFYKYMYSTKTLYFNSSFFFINKKLLSLQNYNFFLKNFLLKNNVKLLVIFDYNGFKNFLKFFSSLNVLLLGLVNINIKPDYLDFWINSNKVFNFVFYNIILNIFFKNYWIKNYNKKIVFLSFFKKYLTK